MCIPDLSTKHDPHHGLLHEGAGAGDVGAGGDDHLALVIGVHLAGVTSRHVTSRHVIITSTLSFFSGTYMLQCSMLGNCSLRMSWTIFSLRTELARPVSRLLMPSLRIWSILLATPFTRKDLLWVREMYVTTSFSRYLKVQKHEEEKGEQEQEQEQEQQSCEAALLEVGHDTDVLEGLGRLDLLPQLLLQSLLVLERQVSCYSASRGRGFDGGLSLTRRGMFAGPP